VILKRDWLWDRKISLPMVKAVLKNPADPRFFSLAGLLLARKNNPREVLKGYLTPLIFLQNWQGIRKAMRKDDWNNPRIEYWQAIYEKLSDKYKKKGIVILKKPAKVNPKNEFCKTVGNSLRQARIQKGLTQKELARKLKVSQQLVSRVESGRENLSLRTLKNFVDGLKGNLKIAVD
jgi:DNA-binding XRE family transcriptional regulator